MYLYWKEKERKNVNESLRLWYNHTAGVGEADILDFLFIKFQDRWSLGGDSCNSARVREQLPGCYLRIQRDFIPCLEAFLFLLFKFSLLGESNLEAWIC